MKAGIQSVEYGWFFEGDPRFRTVKRSLEPDRSDLSEKFVDYLRRHQAVTNTSTFYGSYCYVALCFVNENTDLNILKKNLEDYVNEWLKEHAPDWLEK